jgi:hypothetical protein
VAKKDESNLKGKLLAATGLGMELVGLVIVLFYAGHYIDYKYELPGYGVTIGGMIALIVWLTHVVIVVQGLDKEE